MRAPPLLGLDSLSWAAERGWGGQRPYRALCSALALSLPLEEWKAERVWVPCLPTQQEGRAEARTCGSISYSLSSRPRLPAELSIPRVPVLALRHWSRWHPKHLP